LLAGRLPLKKFEPLWKKLVSNSSRKTGAARVYA